MQCIVSESQGVCLLPGLVARNGEIRAASVYPGDSEAHKRKLDEISQSQRLAEETLQAAQKNI